MLSINCWSGIVTNLNIEALYFSQTINNGNVVFKLQNLVYRHQQVTKQYFCKLSTESAAVKIRWLSITQNVEV